MVRSLWSAAMAELRVWTRIPTQASDQRIERSRCMTSDIDDGSVQSVGAAGALFGVPTSARTAGCSLPRAMITSFRRRMPYPVTVPSSFGDMSSGTPIAPYHLIGSAAIEDGVIFSPNGDLIAAATNGKTNDTRVWNIDNGRQVASPEGRGRHQIEAKSMAFSPDGRTLAIALATGTVQFFDTSTWMESAAPIE